MQSSKTIRHSTYAAPSTPRLTWNSLAHGAALVAAFVFLSAVICGVL